MTSHWEKLVSDYLHISVLDVEGLDYLDYLRYRRDAFIYKLSETESGREYLANARRLEQTSLTGAGRSRLRELFGANTPEGSDDVSHRHSAE